MLFWLLFDSMSSMWTSHAVLVCSVAFVLTASLVAQERVIWFTDRWPKLRVTERFVLVTSAAVVAHDLVR
ncbi:hypothetical protein J1614_008601 [Plenodomus biglobosus]|nr:hypothetical protein J1614_008601 [Plenodomus biglobosus]